MIALCAMRGPDGPRHMCIPIFSHDPRLWVKESSPVRRGFLRILRHGPNMKISAYLFALMMTLVPEWQPQQPQQPTQPMKIRREEVLVDVIVTDRNGKPVTDLI